MLTSWDTELLQRGSIRQLLSKSRCKQEFERRNLLLCESHVQQCVSCFRFWEGHTNPLRDQLCSDSQKALQGENLSSRMIENCAKQPGNRRTSSLSKERQPNPRPRTKNIRNPQKPAKQKILIFEVNFRSLICVGTLHTRAALWQRLRWSDR